MQLLKYGIIKLLTSVKIYDKLLLEGLRDKIKGTLYCVSKCWCNEDKKTTKEAT